MIQATSNTDNVKSTDRTAVGPKPDQTPADQPSSTITTGVLVANLPAVAMAKRAFVTDALGPAFGAAVVGGGAVAVPVYSDGVGWFVG